VEAEARQGRSALRIAEPDERVASVMALHGRTLLRTANHWSICHDDALDAYQRALEIFLRRAHAVQPETEVAWLKVVIKHEALAIRRARSESVSGEEHDLDGHEEARQRTPDEQVAGGERVSRSAEALRALKPDERRALVLKAQGYSYQEIGEQFGWTYTKVNRSITEGRRHFMKVFQAIESGEACERYVSTIAALAGGSATSAEVIEIRPHLRHCVACRATVRQLHLSAGTRLELLLPSLASLDAVTGPVEHTPDHVLDADQLAVLLEVPERTRGLRLGRIRDELLALLHRANGSDAAAGTYIATSGGGGRISTIAAVIAFCVSGAGAGALCVATGVVQTPRWILGQESRPPAPRPHAKHPAQRHRPAQLHAAARTTDAIATPTPVATPRPARPTRRKAPRTHRPADPSQGTTPTSHESAPVTPAPAASTSEFAFESSAGSSASPPPASAPATGGDEFTP